MTNGLNSITQLEAPSPEEIVVDKILTGISVLSGATGETSSCLTGETRASVTPEKEKIPSCVSTNKGSNSKSVLKTLGLQKYQVLPPHVPPFPPGMK